MNVARVNKNNVIFQSMANLNEKGELKFLIMEGLGSVEEEENSRQLQRLMVAF